jgi:DNA repair photolyase
MTARRIIPINAQARPDATVPAAVKGRGTSWVMPPRFATTERVVEDDGWGSMDQAVEASTLAPGTTIIEQQVKTILSSNQSPDIPFDYSINPYRGCEHGCIYCFARPTHSFLDMSPGLDFETRIVAKVNAAEQLTQTLSHRNFEPAPLSLGAVTDAYQPVERKLRITRSILEVLDRFKHPVSIITKSSGIERDIDLLAPMAINKLASVYVSITTLDPKLARTMEPRAASPERRLQTIAKLTQAGIPVGVSVSPIIPFVNEPELERILEAAHAAGARSAFSIVLRLPWEVNPLFQQWLEAHFPDRAARVMARVRELRNGRDNDPSFGSRMTGEGVWSMLYRQRFERTVRRLGLNTERQDLDLTQFVRLHPKAEVPQVLVAQEAAPGLKRQTQRRPKRFGDGQAQEELF